MFRSRNCARGRISRSFPRRAWRKQRVIQEAYIQGVSTRSVDDLVKTMGMTGVSKRYPACAWRSTNAAFLDRPLEGEWP